MIVPGEVTEMQDTVFPDGLNETCCRERAKECTLDIVDSLLSRPFKNMKEEQQQQQPKTTY